jgi:hypothetical protein
MGARPRRRREVEGTPSVELAADPIEPHERVDPRLTTLAPASVQADPDPEAILRWAATHHPAGIVSDAEVLARRESSARLRAWRKARMEARRKGLPLPELETAPRRVGRPGDPRSPRCPRRRRRNGAARRAAA